MTDSDLEAIYKAALGESHFAGLRAVYDTGYYQGSGANLAIQTTDVSLTQPAPTTDPIASAISTP